MQRTFQKIGIIKLNKQSTSFHKKINFDSLKIWLYESTVEPLIKDTFGTSRFVLCRSRGCPLLDVIFYGVCMQEYFWLVLCWEVCPLSECPLSEVSLYNKFSELLPSNWLWPLWWVQCWRLGNEKLFLLKPFQELENGLLIAMCLIVWSVWKSKKVCTINVGQEEGISCQYKL